MLRKSAVRGSHGEDTDHRGQGNMKRLGKIAAVAVVGSALVASGALPGGAQAQEKVLKIGQLGVMSGPAASWGLVNRYTAEAQAQMINEEGGVEIGGETYRIEIVSVDDKNDPRVATAGMERLAYQDGVHYVIGPNVDETSSAVAPVADQAGVFNISYGFLPDLFTQPSKNTALGMIASYQAAPIIYEFLQGEKGVESVSFITRNDTSGLTNRDAGVAAAKELGLEVLSIDATYEPGTTDFFPVMGPLVEQNPDLIVLSGVAPSDAPLLVRAARELGYEGLLSTETAQDATILEEIAGELANGFISLGGASTPEIRTPYMEDFIERYTEIAGEWNDEAGTKVYALEMILQTLKEAGPEAIDDTAAFKAAMSKVAAENPFVKGGEPGLKWVGQDWFGQLRQINVPMVINEYRDGAFKTLFIGSVE
jgi:branched-chain amino acid transport system substrate-binding protein